MSDAELKTLVEQNKSHECAAFFRGMSEAKRRILAPLCLKLLKELKKNSDKVLAAEAAVMATGTLSELRALGWQLERDVELAFKLLADRRPEWLGERAEQLLNESHYWFHWVLIRRLVRAGLIDKPQTPNYYLTMISGMFGGGRFQKDASLVEQLLADPELLEDEVWRLFEYEGGGENSLANWDRFSRGQEWHAALLALLASGHLPRERLLLCTLEALERDFNQYRIKWFASFHDALAPSSTELREHAPRYLRLLGVSTPSISSWALEIVKKLVAEGAYEASTLIGGLPPVIASRQKTLAKQALALLSTAARTSPENAREAIAIAATALGHESADVQKAALDLIDKQSARVDSELAVTLASYASVVAPSLRNRLSAWTSGTPNKSSPAKPTVKQATTRAPAKSNVATPAISAELKKLFGIDALLANLETGKMEIPAATFDGTDIPRLRESQRITPIDDLDELIDVCARVVEDEGLTDDAERVFDGLSRLCDQKPEDFSRRVGPLAKRAMQRPKKDAVPFLGMGPGDDLCGLIHAWTTGHVMQWKNQSDGRVVTEVAGQQHTWFGANMRKALGFLSRRSIALAKRVAAGNSAPLLSAPTHSGGWLAAQALVNRVNAWSGEEPDQTDVCLAMLRLASEGRAAALEQLGEVRTEWDRAIRYALGAQRVLIGDSAPLWIAASRARSPWGDDERIEKAFPAQGPDAGRAALYSVTFPTTSFGRTLAKVKSEPSPPKAVGPDCVTVTLHAQRGVGRDLDWELGGPGGGTVGSVRWTATIWPLARDSLFAAALETIADNIDWGGAAWQNKALLEPLLNTGTPLRAMGLMLLVTALAAKEPGEYGLATDIAIGTIQQGRLGSNNLGPMLAQLLPTGLIKPARWQKTLADVARMSPVHALVVQVALQAAFRGSPEKMPRDYAKLLELLYELSVELEQSIQDEACRAFLSQIKSGKAGQTAKALLALPVPDFFIGGRALLQQVLEQRFGAAKQFLLA